jgi:phosphomevalonate kinase
MHIQEMEEGEGALSHDKESKGQNISVGNAETKSNGHMSRGEQETLIETMRSLKIEVQSYKEDNERLMREQNQINSQVMKILNQLHRQARNGLDLRQEEEERYHERRGNYRRVVHSRSASITHRHHSPPYL